MKTLVLSLTCLALIGCSASNGTSNVFNPPPVQAATAIYSNASIVGTYSVNFAGANTAASIGSFIADGNGNITSGVLSEYSGGNPCTASFTGTYALKADASGTISITTKPVGTNGCPATAPNFVIQAAQQGSALLVSQVDPIYTGIGTALKQ